MEANETEHVGSAGIRVATWEKASTATVHAGIGDAEMKWQRREVKWLKYDTGVMV